MRYLRDFMPLHAFEVGAVQQSPQCSPGQRKDLFFEGQKENGRKARPGRQTIPFLLYILPFPTKDTSTKHLHKLERRIWRKCTIQPWWRKVPLWSCHPNVFRGRIIHVPAEWCKWQGPGAHHLDAYWFKVVFQNRLRKSMPQFYWDIWKGQSQRLPLLAEIWTSKAVDQRSYTCTFLSFNKTFVFRLVGMYRAKVQTETSDWNLSILQISKRLMWLES